MKEINIEELKQIQLDILSSVDFFCRENNIKYSLAGGTMIGAIRHKGFIPWDDDIDIFMRRDDYDRFLSIFPNNYKDKYEAKCFEKDLDWQYVYSKVIDKTTILQEESDMMPSSVGIDLFPIDEVPFAEKEWKSFCRKLLFLTNSKEVKIMKWRKGRALYKNIYLYLSKLLLLPFSTRYFVKKIDEFARSNNGKGYKYANNSVFGLYGKQPFEKSVLDSYIDITFENSTFMAFEKYHNYLRSIFGDYMQMPPEEKRITHHSFKAWWRE